MGKETMASKPVKEGDDAGSLSFRAGKSEGNQRGCASAVTSCPSWTEAWTTVLRDVFQGTPPAALGWALHLRFYNRRPARLTAAALCGGASGPIARRTATALAIPPLAVHSHMEFSRHFAVPGTFYHCGRGTEYN
ncbi:hypothetical protein VTN02DRAFT_5390 [Thermoascus thermophilus]